MGKTSTQTQISAPAPEFEGYGAKTLERYARQQFNRDGSPRAYDGPGKGYAGSNPLTNLGYGLGAQALTSQNQYPGIANNYASTLFGAQGGQANQNTLDTMSGKYLDPATNPYIQQTYNRGAKALSENFNSAVMPGLNAAFGQQGASGGSAHRAQALKQAGVLGQSLGDLAQQTYGANYERERALQSQLSSETLNRQHNLIPQLGGMRNLSMQDTQNAIGLGGQYQNLMQGGMDNEYNNAMQAWQFLQSKYPQMAQMLATASRGTGMRTSEGTQPMMSGGALAAGLLGAAAPAIQSGVEWLFDD